MQSEILILRKYDTVIRIRWEKHVKRCGLAVFDEV